LLKLIIMEKTKITPETYTVENDTTHNLILTSEELRFLIALVKNEQFKKEVKPEFHFKIDSLRARIIKIYADHIGFVDTMDNLIEKYKLK